jgi:hypothetical protein
MQAAACARDCGDEKSAIERRVIAPIKITVLDQIAVTPQAQEHRADHARDRTVFPQSIGNRLFVPLTNCGPSESNICTNITSSRMSSNRNVELVKGRLVCFRAHVHESRQRGAVSDG